MTIAGALALYFIIWWTMLFAVLPFGIRSQAEEGDVVQGSEPGAPVFPGLFRKAIATSILSAAVFAIVWYVWRTYDL